MLDDEHAGLMAGVLRDQHSQLQVADSLDPIYVQIRDQSRFWVQRVAVPLIMVVGLFGNLITVVIMTRRRMRSTTNMYLAALALVDMLYLVLTFILGLSHYPNMAERKYYLYWRLKPLLMMLTDACSNTSVWLTVTFTIERFIAVRYPMKGKVWCTEARAKKLIACVFAFAIIFALPVPFEWEVIEKRIAGPSQGAGDGSHHQNTVFQQDTRDNNIVLALDNTEFGRDETYKTIYYRLTAVIFYFLPLLSVTLFNCFLIHSVHKSRKERKRMTHHQNHKSSVQYLNNQSKQKSSPLLRYGSDSCSKDLNDQATNVPPRWSKCNYSKCRRLSRLFALKVSNKMIGTKGDSSTELDDKLQRERKILSNNTSFRSDDQSAIAQSNQDTSSQEENNNPIKICVKLHDETSSEANGQEKLFPKMVQKENCDKEVCVVEKMSSELMPVNSEKSPNATDEITATRSQARADVSLKRANQTVPTCHSDEVAPKSGAKCQDNENNGCYSIIVLDPGDTGPQSALATAATDAPSAVRLADKRSVQTAGGGPVGNGSFHCGSSSSISMTSGNTTGNMSGPFMAASSQERRITVMLIAVVLLFLVCQIPSAAMLLYTSVYETRPNTNEHALLLALGNIFNFLMAINAACNFILYSFLSKKYRRTFVMLFCSCFKGSETNKQKSYYSRQTQSFVSSNQLSLTRSAMSRSSTKQGNLTFGNENSRRLISNNVRFTQHIQSNKKDDSNLMSDIRETHEPQSMLGMR